MLVLVVEDDPDYADIIAETIRQDSHEVVVVATLDGARRFASKGSAEFAIVDVVLPDGTGYEAAAALRAVRPEIPVVFLSSLDRLDDIRRGFEAGADDYVTKPFHPSLLLARVRAVARRALAAAPAGSSNQDPEGLRIDDGDVTFGGKNLGFTELETQILQELAAVPDQVLSYAYLNQRVWDYPNLPDATLIKGHISTIRRKLRAAGCMTDPIRTVHGVGYVFSGTSVPAMAVAS